MSDTPNTLKHLAILMDGNRRWATERGLPKMMGHTEGGKTLKKIADAARTRGIAYFTVWALSTENLQNRTPEELKHLFSLFEQLVDYLDDFTKNNVKMMTIGDLSKLPETTQEKLLFIANKTKDNTGMVFTLAVNYGGRDEILRASKKMLAAGIKPEELTEEAVSSFLDTAYMPDPDLIIRTGDQKRLSGFLPWQSTYAELYFTPIKWPAFTEKDLDEAIDWFQHQLQNKGK